MAQKQGIQHAPFPPPLRAKLYDARHATQRAKLGRKISFPDMHFEKQRGGNYLGATSIETCTNKVINKNKRRMIARKLTNTCEPPENEIVRT